MKGRCFGEDLGPGNVCHCATWNSVAIESIYSRSPGRKQLSLGKELWESLSQNFRGALKGVPWNQAACCQGTCQTVARTPSHSVSKVWPTATAKRSLCARWAYLAKCQEAQLCRRPHFCLLSQVGSVGQVETRDRWSPWCKVVLERAPCPLTSAVGGKQYGWVGRCPP